MVDCGSLRCAQERRSLRRELQSLSKRLPVILGLESIAAQYVNTEDKHKQSSDSPAGSECNPPVCQDFQASSRCYYCEKKVPNIYKRIDRIIGDVRKGKENKGKICLRSLQDLMPFCLDFYTRGFGRELFSESVKNYFIMAAPEMQDEDHNEISNKNSTSGSSQTGELVVPYHMENKRSHKVKEIPRSVEEERDEAIEEGFQRDFSLSEHMAMLYTIPQALINGKGLKKEQEAMNLPFQLLGKDTGLFSLPNPFQLPSSNFSPPSDFNDLVFLRNPPDTLPPPFLHSLPSQQSADILRDLYLTHIRRLHNLNGSKRNQPPPAHKGQLKLPLLVNIVRKLVNERFLEIKRLHRKRQEDNSECSSENESTSPLKTYATTSVSSTLFDEESLMGNVDSRNKAFSFQFSDNNYDGDFLLKRFGKVNERSRIGDTLKGIIGKTISEKMKFRDLSSDENENPEYPKFYQMKSLQSRNPSARESGPYKREADSTTQCDKDSSSPLKRTKKDISKSRCFMNKSSNEGSSKSLKKTRPKRGQYRKYNSQLLMDAVRAVQRGEMSVHRAGSFFGVPHSTLEYKVKERHLLRQRKGRDSSSLSSSASPPKNEIPLVTTINLSRDSSPALSEASLTSKKFNEPVNSKTSIPISSPPPQISKQDEMKNHSIIEPRSNGPLTLSSSQVSCLPFSISGRSQDLTLTTWLPPYLSSSSSSSQYDSSVGFPSSGMSLNTSASELLRKLQHKVQSEDCVSHDSTLHLPLTKDSAYERAASKENSGELAESLTVFH